jgi:hypothetical protein
MSIQDPAPYGVREFDLSVSRANQKITVKADNFAILSAEDSATIRVNSPDAAGIPAREISGLTIAKEEGAGPGIERIYLTNAAGSGKLRLLTGFGVASGSTSTPSDDTTDVSNRAAREIGKARIEDSGGVLVDPATNGASTPDKREISSWSAGTIPTTAGGNQSAVSSGSNATISPGASFSFASATVPDGVSVSYKAATGNTSEVEVGSFLLQPGDAIELAVDDVSVPTFSVPSGASSDQEMQYIYEG